MLLNSAFTNISWSISHSSADLRRLREELQSVEARTGPQGEIGDVP